MTALGTEAVSEPALFAEEHKAYRESFRTFLERRVVPFYPDWRREGRLPRGLFRACGEDGFLGPQVPERYGGAGVEDPRFRIVLAQEAMAAGVPALALALTGHNDAAVAAIAKHGSEVQQAKWLPVLASGEALAAVAYGDFHFDGDRVDGEAHFVVQGEQADLFIILANRANDPGSDRLALVERDAIGVEVKPSPPGIGLDGAALADISLHHARSAPVGDSGSAAKAMVDFQLGLAASALAGAQQAFAVTLAYVTDRKAFGQPIASFQNTRHVLASASASIAAGEAFLETCLRDRLNGALGFARAATLKLHCSELYGVVVDHGVQLHGGYGYILEYEIAHAYADARFWRLYGGTTEAMRDLIADAIFR